MSKESLKETLDEAEWSWIKPHLQRDAVILVARPLNLLDVGDAIAEDDSARLQEWIKEGLVGKPSAEQVQEWDKVPARRFMALVVQPYVLMQELIVH